MSSHARIEALAFDHYGTLFDKGAIGRLLDRHVPGRGQEFAQFWFRTMQRYCFQNGLMERYQGWDELTANALTYTARVFGLALDDALREQLIQEDLSLPPFPEVPAALERLAARLDLFVLSMASRHMLEHAHAKAGTRQHFVKIISGEARKVYKPAKAAYRMGVDEIARPREQIGFVSGNSYDVIGAVNFGFTTFWINRTGEPLDVLGPEPHWTGSDMQALADLLAP